MSGNNKSGDDLTHECPVCVLNFLCCRLGWETENLIRCPSLRHCNWDAKIMKAGPVRRESNQKKGNIEGSRGGQ